MHSKLLITMLCSAKGLATDPNIQVGHYRQYVYIYTKFPCMSSEIRTFVLLARPESPAARPPWLYSHGSQLVYIYIYIYICTDVGVPVGFS